MLRKGLDAADVDPFLEPGAREGELKAGTGGEPSFLDRKD